MEGSGTAVIVNAEGPTTVGPSLGKDRTANGAFASISPVANSRTVGFGYLFAPNRGFTPPRKRQKNVRNGGTPRRSLPSAQTDPESPSMRQQERASRMNGVGC